MRSVRHDHEPLYRLVRASWSDPLDASFSRGQSSNRWNPPSAFAALYTCCGESVARAVVLDLLKYAGVVFDDLRPEVRPQLAEISWAGEVVDVASAEGVAAAGFPPTYPKDVDHQQSQPRAVEWHAGGSEGVMCRSASLERMGISTWDGVHNLWGEVAIFVENARRQPRLIRRRTDLDWL